MSIKKTSKVVALFLAVVLAISTIPLMTLAADEEVTSGSCGEDATWLFDVDTGVMTISGRGSMENYHSSDYVPWYSLTSDIKSVQFIGDITNVGSYSFWGCANLESVSLPDSLLGIEGYAFACCYELSNVTIPDTVVSIEERAFYSCNLKNIKIPKNVEKIGEQVFWGCGEVNSIEVATQNEVYHSSGNCLIETSSGRLILGCKESMIPTDGSVTVIENGAFSFCSELEYIKIPDSVATIGDSAFEGTGLEYIEIPDSVYEVGKGAFADCGQLHYIKFPNNLSVLESSMFGKSNALKTIYLPKSLTTIKAAVFYSCFNLTDVYYGGSETEWQEIVIGAYNICLDNATIHYNATAPCIEKIQYGGDKFTFGEDIAGYVGDEIDTLVVYTSANENIESLDITSSNTDVVEIGTIEIGVGDYITSENEHIATIPLKLKAEGSSTITITSLEGVSESITVTVEPVSYEIKMYSSFPTLVVDKNSSNIVAIQTERNGMVLDSGCEYTFAVSNSDIVTVSNLEYVSDGAYLTLAGHNEGTTKITITETNTGAVFSTTIAVAEQTLTYNATAFGSTSVEELGCNGFVSGMYIDEFVVSEPVNNCYPVTFNVYNSKNIVGVVEVYDSNGQLKKAESINRFDGGTVTSIQDIFVSGWEIFKDGVDGNLGTYKDSVHSEETAISIEVPVGGYIKITNNPTASETCAIYNCTEFLVNSYLLYGNVLDEVKGSVHSGTNEEIAKMVAESASKEVVADFINGRISSDEVNNKLNSMGIRLMVELLEITTESVSPDYLKGTADSFVEVCKLIFSESGIDIVELIEQHAISLGFSGLEQYVLDEVGLVGDIISATFMANETQQYAGYVVALFGKSEYKEMSVYFNDIDGSLISDGVSIKSENGTTVLSESNFVMHSIVLSNDDELTDVMKDSLDKLSSNYVVRNIYLERDGVISQPGQNVQVYVPVPKDYNIYECAIYWVKDDGSLEIMSTSIAGDCLVFTTDHFSYYALVDLSARSISGLITSYGDNSNVTLRLMEGLNEVEKIESTSGFYEFTGIAKGTYTLEVSKANHVTRTYEVVVINENVVQNVKIHLLGDVNGDGKVNTIDVNRVYAHVRETNPLTGYALECANVAGSGSTVNTIDVNRIYAHVKETNLLW